MAEWTFNPPAGLDLGYGVAVGDYAGGGTNTGDGGGFWDGLKDMVQFGLGTWADVESAKSERELAEYYWRAETMEDDARRTWDPGVNTTYGADMLGGISPMVLILGVVGVGIIALAASK